LIEASEVKAVLFLKKKLSGSFSEEKEPKRLFESGPWEFGRSLQPAPPGRLFTSFKRSVSETLVGSEQHARFFHNLPHVHPQLRIVPV
jgi:hypothetical protein